jgi:putative redox protein
MASLGACTSMTLRMYAEHKGLALRHVSVQLSHERVHAEDCEACEHRTGRIELIHRRISLRGDLTAAQRKRMLEIADRCPVHRTLGGPLEIHTHEAD